MRIRRLARRRRAVRPSPRVVEVCRRFGLERGVTQSTLVDDLTVAFQPGSIVLVHGPSGVGKSSVLDAIARRFPTSRLVNVATPADRPIIETVAADGDFDDAVSLLSACGISEPRLWLHRFDELSDGERFRARLALAFGLHLRTGDRAPLLCDEFGAVLHRRIARAIAFNLRKLVSRTGVCLVVATTAQDLTADLQPNQDVALLGDGKCAVAHRAAQRRPFSLRRRLVIERGSRRDYVAFSDMHYRQRDELGFVDKCFVLREAGGGDALGIVVYAHAPLELRLRNEFTDGRFKGNAQRLNRELRILRRLVIHPDVRGCGLGQHLVRRTLPEVGTRFVECLANLGMVNPVFERSGMTRVGTCARPKLLEQTLAALRALGVDPLSPGFESDVCRRPGVRRLVAASVRQWYQGLTRGGERRVDRQSPTVIAKTFRQLVGSTPVYYLWERRERSKNVA